MYIVGDIYLFLGGVSYPFLLEKQQHEIHFCFSVRTVF